ncbi:11918_t:CDS:1, partial [Cetraspora pellucida]
IRRDYRMAKAVRHQARVVAKEERRRKIAESELPEDSLSELSD